MRVFGINYDVGFSSCGQRPIQVSGGDANRCRRALTVLERIL